LRRLRALEQQLHLCYTLHNTQGSLTPDPQWYATRHQDLMRGEYEGFVTLLKHQR
jgi:hypothetical protein